jgi:hypothetical protein
MQQPFAMYGYYTTFALRTMDQENDTPYNRTYGPRDVIETLTEILHIFSVVITEENEFTPTTEFRAFLERQLAWLASIDDDNRLYEFRNKSHLTELTTFLTYPHPQLNGCIKYADELTDIAKVFRFDHNQLGRRVLNTFSNNHISLHMQFAGVHSHLFYIMRCMLPADCETMKENNRDLYCELNAYIMHPDRIDKMYTKYGLDYPCEYLDAIGV